MSRELAVLITLLVYKVTLVTLGLLAQRRTRDGVDFFLGGRQLGPLVAAISASASSSSAWTLLAVSGAAFQFGLSAIWLFPSCVGGFLLNWSVIAPRMRRLRAATDAVTLTEVLAGPRGHALRPLIVGVASLIVLFSFSVYVGSQFHGAGKTFAETFGLDEGRSILIGSAVVLFYTLLGGFWAVSLTDTLQGLLMAATAVLLPVGALVQVGGFANLADGLREVQAQDYLSLTRNFAGTSALGFVLGTLGIGLGYPGQPHVVNRFLALRRGEDALRSARRIAVAWALVVYAGMLLLGLCGRVIFDTIGDQEKIFIKATNELFPPIVAGIMIAAVLSAIMSTADSQLLVAASAVTHDLELGGGRAATMLRRSRLVVLAVGAIAVLIAFVMIRNKRIFDSVLFAWSALGAAFGPLLLVTVLRGPVSPPRTLLAMIAGFSLSILASTTTSSPGKILENVMPSLVAFLIAWSPVVPRSSRRSFATSERPRPGGGP